MKKFTLIILISCIAFISQATHLRAGQISVQQKPGSLTCIITITVFTNTKSLVLFGGLSGEFDILNFGDGISMAVLEQPNTVREDLGDDIGIAQFTIEHTYDSYGSYLVSYVEPNRNEGVLNFSNSVTTSFYLESFITLSQGETYKSPTFIMPPVLLGTLHSKYSESLGAVDSVDYQLFYHLETPKQARDRNVEGFEFPEGLSLDPISGLLTWDTKFHDEFLAGEYAFAVKVYQVKNNSVIGYSIRDFQIILTDKMTEDPSMEGGRHSNGRLYIPADDASTLTIVAGSDAKTEIEIASELQQFPENFSYSIYDSVAGSQTYKVAKISVENNATIIRDTPYLIVGRVKTKTVKKDITYLIATKDINYTVPLILGTEEVENNGITLAPNPVKDFLRIENENGEHFILKISGSMGNTLKEISITDNTQLDLRFLESGVYLFSFHTKTKTNVYKIIKE